MNSSESSSFSTDEAAGLTTSPAPASRPLVLLADDDETFRHAIGTLLARSGYGVVLASNGCAALDQLKIHPVKVAILDLIMPQMEGIETILKIREFDTGIKVVAISGGGRVGGHHYLGMARRLGAHAVLAKPFTSDLLLSAIERALLLPVSGMLDPSNPTEEPGPPLHH